MLSFLGFKSLNFIRALRKNYPKRVKIGYKNSLFWRRKSHQTHGAYKIINQETNTENSHLSEIRFIRTNISDFRDSH